MGSLGNSTQLLSAGVLRAAVLCDDCAQPAQAKEVAGDAGQAEEWRQGDHTGGIRGVVVSVKDDAVQLRIAPDNIKLEFAKGRHCVGDDGRNSFRLSVLSFREDAEA